MGASKIRWNSTFCTLLIMMRCLQWKMPYQDLYLFCYLLLVLPWVEIALYFFSLNDKIFF